MPWALILYWLFRQQRQKKKYLPDIAAGKKTRGLRPYSRPTQAVMPEVLRQQQSSTAMNIFINGTKHG